MIWFCSMTESNLHNTFFRITKGNLKFKIYFLKNISYYFINVFYSLDHLINKLLHYSFSVQKNEGYEVELFQNMGIRQIRKAIFLQYLFI